MIRYRLLHILLLCSLLLTLPLPVVAAPGVTSGVDLTVTVTASPGGAFPAQVTVYLALATGGGEQQKVVTPAAPTAVFTDLYRNRIYKIQAVPGQSTGAFPSAMASVLTPAFGTPEPQSLQLGDTPPISGHIMKPDLSTAAPGRVDVLNATCTQVLFSTGTSSQGYYELSLRDGAYCLRARPEDTVNYEDSAPKPVLSNAAAPQIIDLPLKARSMNTIRGRAVTDEQPPRPVKDARIVAQKLDASEAVSTTTDAEGHYSLQVPAKPATWMLSAEVDAKTSPGGLKAPLPRQVTFTTSDVITVTRDFTFTLPVAETHIVGTVLVTDTVPFVPTIPVTVTAINLITFQRASTAIDPDNGSFDLSVPGGGLYQILVVPADLLRYLPINLPQVLVSKGETKDLGTLYLIPTAVGNMATISGRVLTTEDEPVAGVRVHGLRLTDKAPALPVITREDGSFTLLVPPGTWWVAVALQEGDPYMPYRLRWQTVVTVGAHETVDDVELRVRAANATIHAVLTEGEGGNQAADACGALAAYKKGEPGVYNFGTFSHGSFDLPVIPGTYRLEVVPEPGLQENLPEDCAGGKYLPATVANLEVTASGVTTVTIPLQSSLATIHGQLWDRFQDRAVTGWGGMMFGWSPTLKTWSAARIDETTGRGDLRASPGDWLLSFRIDPASGYRPLPPALNVTVPAGQTDVDVQLPVALLNTPVQGRVLDPDGNPVQWVIVQALGVPGADTAVTDKTGAFTLALPIGAYMVEVLGPAEVLSDHDWISPAPQKLVLLPDTPAPELTLQYRRGDADIHGTLVFSSTVASGQGDRRALLTATSFGARSKTWVNMPLAPGQEYHLPALQGRDWWVAASYW
ncbi:MAG: carboxypeptidase regulatory-like domain-containing protein, partial [Caldilineae bacterium]